MPRQDTDALFHSVVRGNRCDFLKRSVADLQRRPKYSVIHFCAGVELFLKPGSCANTGTLIVSKPEFANSAKLQKGDVFTP